MLLRLFLLVAVVCVETARLNAATNPPPVQLSPRERAQGFRDQVVLAKPKADRRATVDRDEAAENIRVREKFVRFGDLRVIELAGDESLKDALARLRATGRYEFVEPDYVMSSDMTVPNDPSFSLQWALNNTGQSAGYAPGADIRALDAWDLGHDAKGVIVAIVDGGVRTDHQDITANLWRNPSPTFGDVNGAAILNGIRSGNINDERGHGTHVAGIIGAVGNNGVGTAGVAWSVQLMIVKNAGSDGLSLSSDSAACIDYAVAHGAKVINCSFGGTSFSNTLYTAIKAARDAGVIVVCAAGNYGLSNDLSPHYPSSYLLDNVIAVGNSTASDSPSSTSDYGALVELFAPGSSIVSTDYTSTTGVVSKSGTSMASPQVAGALALLKARFPNDTYRQLINRLLRSADVKLSLAGRAVTNARMNLYRAMSSTTNRPHNDDFVTRAVVTGTILSMRNNNADATLETENGEPTHTAGATRSLWWHWVAPSTGTYVVDTSGSAYDTVLDVYSGTTSSTLATITPLVANDDYGAAKTSRVSFSATKGDSVFFAVAGKNGTCGYTQVNVAPAPANDNFASAIALTGESAQATSINVSATIESGEPKILGNDGGASIWYKWTAPRSGQFQVSAFTFDFDTLLAVYTGTALDQLTLVSANDDTDVNTNVRNTDSRCTFSAVKDTTYYFQIDTKSLTSRGIVVTTIVDSAWQFSGDGGALSSSPAIAADGMVFIGAAAPDCRLYALGTDGTMKWNYRFDDAIDTSSPAVGADGTIYQGADDGKVMAFTRDGSIRWKRDLGTDNGVGGGIAIAADGTLYLHASDGYLYALNPTDGSTKWRFDAGIVSTFASAVVGGDGTIYQGSDGQKCLFAINPDGTQKWRFDTNGSTFSTPSIDGAGNIYFATYSTSTVYSITPAGTRRWMYVLTTTNAISSSPTLSADATTVYIGAADTKLYAMDTTTGALRWTYTCGDSIYASTPAVDANGVVYIGSYDGKLYAINPNGTLKRTWAAAQKIRSSPAIYGTMLYVGCGDGKVYAFDIGAPAANGPWSQFRNNPRRTGRNQTEPLGIGVAPQGCSIGLGETATLSVVPTGKGPFTFIWKRDGVVINGATSSSYTITNASAGSAGAYTVTIIGSQGSVTSPAAFIAVVTYDPGHLSNLSIRTSAGTGDQTLIVGTTVSGGAGTNIKPMLIRAVGPTLATFGVSGAIPDPVLSIFRSGQTAALATNDGWRADTQIAAVAKSVGAFPLVAASADAALYRQLEPTGYTMQVCGKTGTGIALVELYDATVDERFTSALPRLTNVSARTQVGTGDNVLIAGFAISGTSPVRLLIRAVGPTLARYGVNGVLANPKLEVFGANGAKMNENDDWGGRADYVEAAKSVGAFDLDPASKDAALIFTLDPGVYSAIVRGVGETTGVALVEIYELPRP